MNSRKFSYKIFLLLALSLFCGCDAQKRGGAAEDFASFAVDAADANKIEFFWRDAATGANFGSIQNLKNCVERGGKHLRFAMNGGMYQEDGRPLGLFIQNGKTLAPLNRRAGAKGNFYIEPNGVFYITNDGKAHVVKTADFTDDGAVKIATQSGPMLVADGEMNPQFKADSDNLNVRNGVCVLADGAAIFVVSRRAVSFYDFARYFKNAGCADALYLDGFVSRMYLPEKSITVLDGDFGVIIGITEK